MVIFPRKSNTEKHVMKGHFVTFARAEYRWITMREIESEAVRIPSDS
jgi:hypothetical protein